MTTIYTTPLIALFIIITALLLGITLKSMSSPKIQKRDKQVISVTLILGFVICGVLNLYIFLFGPAYSTIKIMAYVVILGLMVPIVYVFLGSIFGKR